MLARDGWPDYEFSFHDGDELGRKILSRVAKRTGLRPNRDLNEFGVFGQIKFYGGQIEPDCILDVPAGFLFDIPIRRASWKFRTHCRVGVYNWIEFENHPELHLRRSTQT